GKLAVKHPVPQRGGERVDDRDGGQPECGVPGHAHLPSSLPSFWHAPGNQLLTDKKHCLTLFSHGACRRGHSGSIRSRAVDGYQQVFDPIAGSLAWSALFAALPLATLFVLLGALRWKAWKASIAALAVSLAVAIFAYSMPVGQALLAASEGAAFGLFPIIWIVLNALWIYKLTEITGYDQVLRRAFGSLSDDQRIQAIIIAFCFGALLEALAGFGTPVAVSSVMLMAVGLRPMKAAAVSLVANTAPVAFGAIAVPITTLGKLTGL